MRLRLFFFNYYRQWFCCQLSFYVKKLSFWSCFYFYLFVCLFVCFVTYFVFMIPSFQDFDIVKNSVEIKIKLMCKHSFNYFFNRKDQYFSCIFFVSRLFIFNSKHILNLFLTVPFFCCFLAFYLFIYLRYFGCGSEKG